MIRMQIQFTPEQVDAVHRESQRLGVSHSEVVRRSLEAYLGRHIPPDRATARERAGRLLGAFSGGPSDVAVRHDEYLSHDLAEDMAQAGCATPDIAGGDRTGQGKGA